MQVLEFKHPYFRVDSKDDLDNIRRKAPAPRKPQMTEDYSTNQHIGVISEQLTATQQQVQQLQELFAEVSQTNRILVNEVLTLQKMLNAQKQAQHEMLNYLTPYDGQTSSVMDQTNVTSNGASASDGDEAVPELRRARELLSSVSANSIADRELERLHGVYGSPVDSGSVVATSTIPMMDPMNDITRYPVYPVGQTVGIDPFSSDNISKIPYAMPNDMSSSTMGDQPQAQHPSQPQHQQQPSQSQYNVGQQKSSASIEKSDSALWGPKRPRVFLVEDDGVCAKIGIKFLQSMGCEVEHAVSNPLLFLSSRPSLHELQELQVLILCSRMVWTRTTRLPTQAKTSSI
jgi:osomolarity two-component system response regulator SKN7